MESLGLSHLIGSNLLRAYMHGYFMDVRLYRKVHYIYIIFLSFICKIECVYNSDKKYDHLLSNLSEYDLFLV